MLGYNLSYIDRICGTLLITTKILKCLYFWKKKKLWWGIKRMGNFLLDLKAEMWNLQLYICVLSIILNYKVVLAIFTVILGLWHCIVMATKL